VAALRHIGVDIILTAIVALAVWYWLVEYIAYFAVPILAVRLMQSERRKLAIALARTALVVPAIRTGDHKIALRSLLAHLYFREKRYRESLVAYDTLASIQDNRSEVAEAYVKRGDCLKAMGRDDDAKLAWEIAVGKLSGLGDSFTKFKVLADLRHRLGDYGGAYDSYRSAYPLATGRQVKMRASICMSASSLANKLLKHDEAIEWGEEGIKQGASDSERVTLYDQIGAACLALGDLPGGERCFLAEMDAAKKCGAKSKISRAESRLAVIDEYSGRIDAAMERYRSADPGAADPNSALGMARCHAYRGRYDEAIEHYAAMAEGLPDKRVWTMSSDQLRATADIAMARIHARLGRFDEAQTLLDRAQSLLKSEPAATTRHTLIATRAEVFAREGLTTDTRGYLDEAIAALPEIEGNPLLGRGCLATVASALYHAGEYESARDVMGRAIANGPFPVALPQMYNLLGQCEAALGNADAAREAYQSAVSPGIDTVDAREANEALGRLG
jgi:tetratricopeptide (TPR) repeat protein